MPSFNFMGGGNGGLSPLSAYPTYPPSGGGGGWPDVFSQGLNLLGGWAQNRAAERAQKQQQQQLSRMQRAQIGSYSAGASPYMNVNPNLGGAPGNQFTGGGYPMPTGTPVGWPSLGGAVDTINDIYNIGDALLGGGGNLMPSASDGTLCVRKPAPPRLIGAVNNQTGRAAFYRYVGAPILFRGDLTTLRTVKKAVSKFGGLAGKARCFPRRR